MLFKTFVFRAVDRQTYWEVFKNKRGLKTKIWYLYLRMREAIGDKSGVVLFPRTKKISRFLSAFKAE